jgi:hypothetical protein
VHPLRARRGFLEQLGKLGLDPARQRHELNP